ncbi:hypothetical protein VOLCADRAFT_100547 [Volvox carteri f. nagariensis]|uniref:Protein kinase domain-containing protein n=1 Tax=Volvox carteri f. nagariensis TaxID=3068 RepID=D8UKG0_VOLCA|nr:uncharacterized protein VOLCADRAFT_100547 [Volvox carteri f. nagariensis]EFJ39795.1 hypothetical protein VOLCADRAFT_100547 [Volvox carteri f. nagariensis]|eukprot:XP_002959146.1 hypothetical protein VOLCADRAFT_100547 [Volvox carteri f. nagariensis]
MNVSSLAYQNLFYGGYTYTTINSYYVVDNVVSDQCLEERPGTDCVTLLLQQLDSQGQGQQRSSTQQQQQEKATGGGGSSHEQMGAELGRMAQELRASVRDVAIRLEAVIGSGSFGTVYKGTWQGLSVAVKTLVFSASDDNRRRSLQEAALCASISHPNVVCTVNSSQDKCSRLNDTVHIPRSYPCSKTPICPDLNPNNVLLKRDVNEPSGYIVKVGDFGLSVMLPQNRTHLSNLRMGTMFYMCPAVVMKGQVGPPSDGPRYSSIFPAFPPSCPETYRAVALHCLQRQPQNRPPAILVEAHLERLMPAVATAVPVATPPSSPLMLPPPPPPPHPPQRMPAALISPVLQQLGSLATGAAGDSFTGSSMLPSTQGHGAGASSPRYSSIFPAFPPSCPETYRAVALHCLQRQPQNRPPAILVEAHLERLMAAVATAVPVATPPSSPLMLPPPPPPPPPHPAQRMPAALISPVLQQLGSLATGAAGDSFTGSSMLPSTQGHGAGASSA